LNRIIDPSLAPFNPRVNCPTGLFLLPNSLCGIIPHPLFAHVQIPEQSTTLTKAQIVEALFAKNIFTKIQSAQIIETLLELIKQSLQNGEDVLVSGFGKFSVRENQGRANGGE
jgi:hypothetical protein